MAKLFAIQLKPGETPPKVGTIVYIVFQGEAERGVVEGAEGGPLNEAKIRAIDEYLRYEREQNEPPVKTTTQRLWLAKQSSDILEGIKALRVIVEGENSSCRPSLEDQLGAAVRPIIDGGLEFVKDVGLFLPNFYVNVTAMQMGGNCVAYVEVSLEVSSFAAPSYQQAPRSIRGMFLMGPWSGNPAEQDSTHQVAVTVGKLQLETLGSLLTGPQVGFADRVTDKIRRFADQLVTKIKIANQGK